MIDSIQDIGLICDIIDKPLVVIDSERKIHYLNAAAEEFFVTTRSYACGQLYSDILRITDNTSLKRVDLFDKSGRPAGCPESILLAGKNSERYFTYKFKEIKEEGGKGNYWLFIFNDVTLRDDAVRELNNKRKLEVLTDLYTNITQEINNTLSGIDGYARTLENELSTSAELGGVPRLISEAAGDAAGMCQRLLKLSLPAEPDFAMFDIHALLQEFISVLQNNLPENLRIVSSFSAKERVIYVDRAELEAVVRTLILYLHSSLGADEVIRMSTEIIDNTGGETSIHGFELGARRYLKIVIAGGAGADCSGFDELLASEESVAGSENTGNAAEKRCLRGIIKHMQGAVEAVADNDGRVELYIYLPFIRERIISDTAAGEEPLLAEYNLELPPERKVVLLVDDNEVVRMPVREMLLLLNCEVLEAGNGEEALELFVRNRERIDLVILDVVMPVKNGTETLRELREIDRDVRIVMASGYMDQLPDNGFADLGVEQCLIKPYRISEIKRIIQRLHVGDRLEQKRVSETTLFERYHADMVKDKDSEDNEPEQLDLMLVENNESVRELLYEILTEARFRVTVFKDIVQAKEAVNAGKYFAISIIDIDSVSDCDEELFFLLKNNKDNLPRYVIACSSKDIEQIALRTLNLGVDDFILKPFSLNFIRIRIEIARRYIENEQMKNRMQSLLKEGEERMSLAINGVGIGMWDWKIIEKEFYASDKCKAIFGYPEGSTLGVLDHLNMVTVKEDQMILTREFSEYLRNSKKILNTEFRILHPQKGVIWIQAIGKLFDDSINGKPKRLIGIAMDITERKEKENILREESQKLEELVVQRTAELTESNEQLSLEIEAREEAELKNLEQQLKLMDADKLASLGILVSGIGHEINNPVQFIMFNMPFIKNAWISALPVLDEYYSQHPEFHLRGVPYPLVKERLLTMAEDVIEGAERISSIVKDLREYSRKSRKEEFRREDIIEVILSAKSLFLKFYGQRNIDIIIHEPRERILLDINKSRIEQVIINLLHNAALAVEEAGEDKVVIEVCCLLDDDCINIKISDKGVGIKKDDLKHLTDPFFTTRSSDGGTGLGLAMCKKIVHDHAGDMVFESEYGLGTTVTVILPLKTGGSAAVD